MHATEVVKGKPACDGSPVVLPLLAEGIRQASEAPCTHSYRLILALHNRRADALGIGLSVDWGHLHGLHLGGRVPRFAFLRCAINLDELREVGQPIMQRRGDCGTVGSESVRRDLEFRMRRSRATSLIAQGTHWKSS